MQEKRANQEDELKSAIDARAGVKAQFGGTEKKRGHPWTKNSNQKRNKNRARMARESRRANRRK